MIENAPSPQLLPQRPKLRLIKLAEVKDRCALGKTAIYARIKSGTFPKPIPQGDGPAVAWLESDIDEWIEERVRKARGEKEAA